MLSNDPPTHHHLSKYHSIAIQAARQTFHSVGRKSHATAVLVELSYILHSFFVHALPFSPDFVSFRPVCRGLVISVKAAQLRGVTMMVNKAHGHGGSSQNCGAHYVVQIIGVLVVITSNCEGFSTTRLSQPATASTSVRSRLQNINSPLPSARGSTWGLLFAGHGFLGENESGSEFRGASIAPWKTAAPGVESFTESFKVSTVHDDA